MALTGLDFHQLDSFRKVSSTHSEFPFPKLCLAQYSDYPLKLEAGQEYYFLQNTLYGMFKQRTSLSRNSKELVMYELHGAYYADWKRKN